MKRHLLLTTLGSLMLSASLIAHAQEATPAAEPTATPPEATAEAAVEAQPEVIAEVLVADASDVQPADEAVVVTETVTDVAVEADITAPAADEAILIVIDDTPLLDAIRNLARQANINLIIDPQVGYGQTDGTGKSVPQPNVSIRWENITAAQALNALLGNYGLQAVEDPKVQITRITVKDPAAPDPLVTKTIQLQYSSPSNMMAAISATFVDKRSKVVGDNRTSQLVIVTTEKEMVGVEKLVTQLDSPTKQVLIETRLVETSMNPKSAKGIDWSQTLGNSALGIGQGQTISVGNTPGGAINMNDLNGSFNFNPGATFLNANGLNATLSFLNTSADAKVLASPRTVTLDNETAEIEAGQLYPIVNVTAGTANSTGGSQVSYSNLTVKLVVTPRISANNQINLKVVPTVMRLQSVQTFTAGSSADGSPSTFDVPIFATRNLDTRVLIPSGNTLVMGGLITDAVQSGNVKVPILGDLPFLGRLFRQDAKSRDQGNLIIFVTPTIVEDSDFQITKTDYLKTPVAADSFGEDWTYQDTGHPKDWSKPAAQY